MAEYSRLSLNRTWRGEENIFHVEVQEEHGCRVEVRNQLCQRQLFCLSSNSVWEISIHSRVYCIAHSVQKFWLWCYRWAMPYALFCASFIICHSQLPDYVDNVDKQPLWALAKHGSIRIRKCLAPWECSCIGSLFSLNIGSLCLSLF